MAWVGLNVGRSPSFPEIGGSDQRALHFFFLTDAVTLEEPELPVPLQDIGGGGLEEGEGGPVRVIQLRGMNDFRA